MGDPVAARLPYSGIGWVNSGGFLSPDEADRACRAIESDIRFDPLHHLMDLAELGVIEATDDEPTPWDETTEWRLVRR